MVTTIRWGSHRRTAAGFTLIELLIAITILAVGIMGVASMQVTAIQTNARASKYSEATNRGQDRLERLIAMAYDDAGLVNGSETVDNCKVDWTVSGIDLNGDTVEDAKQITVESYLRGATTRKVTLKYVKPNL